MPANASRDIYSIRTKAPGPEGRLPVTEEDLKNRPSGDIFGMTQNAGMGWKAEELGRDPFLICSTLGGLRAPDGTPIALGYHTGHWEIGLLVEEASKAIRESGGLPFAAYCSDPCDGRSQGTVGMFDSLPYRNDAAVVIGRQIRSLPGRKGVLGIATCDKGLPAMLMALAACRDLPVALVPGGVTLPPTVGEDTAVVQTLGARFSHGLISLQHAAEMGCKACGSAGGGCQFLGTAATSQVVAEAMGLAACHSALMPSGEAVWLETARKTANSLVTMASQKVTGADILTDASVRNAMVVHAAFGGSTNLLLHIPAIAFSGGLRRPSVEDWNAINRSTPRLVSVLPNGPIHHPTVRVFLAGGVPEVMLHLRRLNLLDLEVQTIEGRSLGDTLEAWESSERRCRFREILKEQDGVDPTEVIFDPETSRAKGVASTVTFPQGNIAPEGSVIKSTAIDRALLDEKGVYEIVGPARVFTREKEAIAAIKRGEIKAGDVMVVAGCGPMGTGMEETYQLTSALKHLPFGKHVALITDARFSGVSTGACLGHVGPEALAGGPVGKLLDGDLIRLRVDTESLEGSVDLVGCGGRDFDPDEGRRLLAERATRSDIAPDPDLPEHTRMWAAMQRLGGGAWGGCVYDVDAIMKCLE